MNTKDDTHANLEAAAARRAGRRWAITAAALAFAAGAVCTSFAGGMPALPAAARAAVHGHMALSPAAMEAHIDQMVEQCAPDASADQKMRLAAIAKAAVADLRPVHQQFAAAHADAHALLTSPVIDRAALDQWRAAQVQRIDVMSRRVAVAVEDGAEVLTPEQRVQCAGRLGKLMH
jgi:Spy/CpxP family protein refolding chaperone